MRRLQPRTDKKKGSGMAEVFFHFFSSYQCYVPCAKAAQSPDIGEPFVSQEYRRSGSIIQGAWVYVNKT